MLDIVRVLLPRLIDMTIIASQQRIEYLKTTYEPMRVRTRNPRATSLAGGIIALRRPLKLISTPIADYRRAYSALRESVILLKEAKRANFRSPGFNKMLESALIPDFDLGIFELGQNLISVSRLVRALIYLSEWRIVEGLAYIGYVRVIEEKDDNVTWPTAWIHAEFARSIGLYPESLVHYKIAMQKADQLPPLEASYIRANMAYSSIRLGDYPEVVSQLELLRDDKDIPRQLLREVSATMCFALIKAGRIQEAIGIAHDMLNRIQAADLESHIIVVNMVEAIYYSGDRTKVGVLLDCVAELEPEALLSAPSYLALSVLKVLHKSDTSRVGLTNEILEVACSIADRAQFSAYVLRAVEMLGRLLRHRKNFELALKLQHYLNQRYRRIHNDIFENTPSLALASIEVQVNRYRHWIARSKSRSARTRTIAERHLRFGAVPTKHDLQKTIAGLVQIIRKSPMSAHRGPNGLLVTDELSSIAKSLDKYEQMGKEEAKTRERFRNLYPELDEVDISICIQARHGTSLKRTAELLGVTVKAIQYRRTQIRRKLAIPDDMQFSLFFIGS